MKIRKKPQEFEAMRFTGENHREIMDFVPGAYIGSTIKDYDTPSFMSVPGIGGPKLVAAGEYVLKHHDMRYSIHCAAEIEKDYEVVK